jgi:hypothetical protein
MNRKTYLYTKYPDLLPPNANPDLVSLIENFDLLCTGKQPTTSLAQYKVAQALQARQAESGSQQDPLAMAWQLEAHTARSNSRRFRRRSASNYYYPRLRTRFHWPWLVLAFVLISMVVWIIVPKHGNFTGNAFKMAAPLGGPVPPNCMVGAVPAPKMPTLPNSNSNCSGLSVQSVTLDSDRLTVEYALLLPGNYTLSGTQMFDEQGHELKYLGGITSGIANQVLKGSFNQKPSFAKYNPGGEIWFDASSLAGRSGPIKLHLVVAALDEQVPGNAAVKQNNLAGPFSFDLATSASLDNQRGRVSVLNQSDSVNGNTVKLEKVAALPNLTRFYLQGLDNSNIEYELRAGDTYLDNSSNPNVGIISSANGYRKSIANPEETSAVVTTEEGLTVITINQSLLSQSGEWTLIIKEGQPAANYTGQPVRGPWVFRFSPNLATGTGTQNVPSGGATAPPPLTTIPSKN